MNMQNNMNALTDLSDIHIDKTLPVDVKIKDFVRQVDPYHYKVDDITVTAIFTPNAPTLEERYRRLKA